MNKLPKFGQFIEHLLGDIPTADITEIFLMATFFFFVLAIIPPIFDRYRLFEKFSLPDRSRFFVSYAPTLLTSIGILGTFVGIVAGLMHFDPLKIDSSIPALLEGLKTAFVTSLAGMGSAIFLKILTTTWLAPRRQIVEADTGPEDILRALIDQNQKFDILRLAIAGNEETSLVGQLKLMRTDLGDQHRETNRNFTDLRTALSGTEETSLVGQLKLLRQDGHDRHRNDQEIREAFSTKLWQELGEFGDMLSRSATEQMMNALKEVIADFNKNLTEQFGDNFKALDASVQKLVTWQTQYHEQLEQMAAQYAQGVAAITQTEVSVAHISEKSSLIPGNMEKLNDVLTVNQHQINELSAHLEVFQEMRNKAIEAVPQIRTQIEQTVEEITACVQITNEYHTLLLDKSDAYIKSHDAKTQELLNAFTETARQGIETVRAGMEKGAGDMATAVTTSANTLESNVKNLLERTTTSLDTSLKNADQHYGVLLEKSDAYIKSYDAKTQELLNVFTETARQGIETVRAGMEKGAGDMATAVTTSANTLESNVKDLLERTTTSLDTSLKNAEQHYGVLLDKSDAYIKSHDAKTQELMERYGAAAAEGITRIREGLTASAETAKTAIVTGAETLDRSVQQIQSNLSGTSELLTTQHERMRQHLEDHLKGIIQYMQGMFVNLSEDARGLSNSLKLANEQIQRDTQAIQQRVAESIDQMQKRIESALEDSFVKQERATAASVEKVLEEMRKAVSKMGDSVNQNLTVIEQAMQKEINLVMNEMGNALAQIAGNFTTDYAELVRAMRTIIDQAGQNQ